MHSSSSNPTSALISRSTSVHSGTSTSPENFGGSRGPLQQHGRPDRSSTGSHDQTSSIGEDYRQWVPSVQGDDLVGADGSRSSKEQEGQSDGRISRRPSQLNTEPSPTDIYPPQFDLDELQKAQAHGNPTNGHPHGAKSNLQSTPGGRNISRRHVRSMDFCKLATREITHIGADIAVGVDLDQGLDSDEGKYWFKTQGSLSEPELALGTREAVVKDDHNTQNTPQTNGNQVWAPNVRTPQSQGCPPHSTPPQPDFLILHHPSKCYVSLYFT